MITADHYQPIALQNKALLNFYVCKLPIICLMVHSTSCFITLFCSVANLCEATVLCNSSLFTLSTVVDTKICFLFEYCELRRLQTSTSFAVLQYSQIKTKSKIFLAAKHLLSYSFTEYCQSTTAESNLDKQKTTKKTFFSLALASDLIAISVFETRRGRPEKILWTLQPMRHSKLDVQDRFSRILIP